MSLPTARGCRVEPLDPVARRFFRTGRLTVIPARQSKRRLVLDYLAQEFEPGRLYSETVVNRILRRYHPDCAALRRYLIDEGFMDRRDGWYWRTGGTFDVS